MATRTGPDLSPAEAALNGLMDDICVITRDTGGTEDAVLDQSTGELIDSSPEAKYTGACLLSAPRGLVSRPQEEGGNYYSQSNYSLSLPLKAMREDPTREPVKGDYVTITSSRRDPGAVGKVFRITEVITKTMAASRKCSLELRQ